MTVHTAMGIRSYKMFRERPRFESFFVREAEKYFYKRDKLELRQLVLSWGYTTPRESRVALATALRLRLAYHEILDSIISLHKRLGTSEITLDIAGKELISLLTSNDAITLMGMYAREERQRSYLLNCGVPADTYLDRFFTKISG